MQNRSKYFLNNREVSEEEFYGKNNLSVSNPFRGEKQVNEAVKETIGLSTRHKLGKKMVYLDEAIEQSQKDDTITNVSRGEKEMMEWAQNKLNHPDTETNNCSYTMCGQAECGHCYPKEIDILDLGQIKIPKPTTINKSDYFDRKQKEEEVIDKFRKNMETKEAYKETEGKLFYELDWSFITQMAERMASNKKEGKYEMFNWKNPMTPKGIEDLKQATMRHLLAVMQGEYEDDDREFGHIEAISDNMMMLNYQLKNK
jgi:hypothetical protein